MAVSDSVSGTPSVGNLLELLASQREALLARGPGAAEEVEAHSRRLEEALAGFAAATSVPAAASAANGRAAIAAARPSPAELARLQDELQATQAVLSRLAAGNRRALDTLFGEASLYSR